MRRVLLSIVLLAATVASGAQIGADTQADITAQLLGDMAGSSGAALAERDSAAASMSALSRVAADLELLEILIAQRQLSADVAVAGARQPSPVGYYNALGVAVGAYQNTIAQAQATRAQSQSQIYTQGQQNLVNATQRDLNGAISAVHNAQLLLDETSAQKPEKHDHVCHPACDHAASHEPHGVAVAGSHEQRRLATVTRIDRGRRTPVALEAVGIAQAADGTAFAYGEHMAMPSTAGPAFEVAPTGSFSYGSETWTIPAGAIRDEGGKTYIIGYMTTPMWTPRGAPVPVKLPKSRVSEGDRVWLYDYVAEQPGPWGGGASATATATAGGAVATASAGGGAVVATGGGGHGHGAGPNHAHHPTHPNPQPKPHADITDPGSTAHVYRWPIIDPTTGEVTTYATTKPTWGRTPALDAPPPGPTPLEPGQTVAVDERGVHVQGDAGRRAAPPSGDQPVLELRPLPRPRRFGDGGLSLQRADLVIADARGAYLADVADYADECDRRIEAAQLGDLAGMSAEMADAIRVFRLDAMGRHGQYESAVHRAIRGMR